ncbi:MAG TPA: hypothetical protein VKE69_01640 [Planctomycetota bacterium]|nr:hypothetical protein [Planctomycetota bacterium]
MHLSLSTLVAALALLAARKCASAVASDDRLIATAFAVGDERSLPWGSSVLEPDAAYDRARVVDDTLDVLKTAKSVSLRMETLRRATIYVGSDRARATELLAKLGWMALDAEAAKNAAWAKGACFDAGFLAACYAQAKVDVGWKPAVEDGVQGWAWIRRAIDLGADDPSVRLAASLVRPRR